MSFAKLATRRGSMSESCESRLKPCPGDREPVLRKLYIDLCNLIVESRIPGIDDRGYGEGIHCPPLMGPNTHCCDLSIPECQKHQKLIHRLLRSMKRNIFDVEVFMLPDCCRETKLAERIPKKEYVLLEQWSFNCFQVSKLQPSIDVPQLLRAVRSFIYFSQISAWLSANEGKSPSNIYYWVRPSSEVSSAKFENEPEIHRFPLCKIYEGLYGAIEVKYRTRTQYVPIIPCSKHPPQENPLITVIENSDVRQTICLGSHIVKQLHKTCDTINESPISDKTTTEPLSNVLVSSNMPQSPVKAICGDVSDNISKGKGILKHSNCQIYSESVLGLLPNLPLNVDSDINVRKSIKPLNSIRDEDVIIRHPSPKALSQRNNLTLPIKGEIRQRKLSRELLDSSSTDTDFSSLDSSPTSTNKSKRKRHSSKALVTNSKLSHISCSNSKMLQHSSLIRSEDGNDSSNSTNATSSDAINIHNLNKTKPCHVISEQTTLPNKLSLAADFKKRDTEFSAGSKTNLNLSQHSLRLPIQNWNDEKFSPISSKIIVSKCEPLLPQESSVPNRTKKSCRGKKRKASKCAHKCKYLCDSKNSSRNVDGRSGFEKDGLPHLDSKSNVSPNFMKPNNAEKSLASKPELHSESRKRNYKHKRIKKEAKALSSATASTSSSHTKKSLREALDTSKANTDSTNDSSKLTRVCCLGPENVHSACNRNQLCSEDVQLKCLDRFPIENISNLERRTFRKRKVHERSDCYAKPEGEISDKKTLFTIDEPGRLQCPSLHSNKPSKLKIQRRNTHNCRRKKIGKLLDRAESEKQPLCRCSLANSNVILEHNLECFNQEREAESTSNSTLNTSQSSKIEQNVSCISNPNISVDVSTATGKSFKTEIQLQEQCELNTSKTKVQLTLESAPKTGKTVYPSASNELICDYTPERLLKSYGTANFYSEARVDCLTVRKLNTNEGFTATKLKKGRRLLLNFEESILAGCLEPVKTVIGYKVEIGASGSFCPDHLTLPADVSFYELKSSHQHTVPYMAHVAFENIEYYLPKKGSMQVTLFNPSETVVKMFVLNYDLSNMPPLHHTFIRQKTYYMPVSAEEKDPKWLRYIIHLRFASSKTGRIFLHKDFKIVVLNRSNDDAACDHIQQPCELRSFLSVPKNPAFSSL